MNKVATFILPVIQIVYLSLDNFQQRCLQRSVIDVGGLYGGKIVDL